MKNEDASIYFYDKLEPERQGVHEIRQIIRMKSDGMRQLASKVEVGPLCKEARSALNARRVSSIEAFAAVGIQKTPPLPTGRRAVRAGNANKSNRFTFIHASYRRSVE